MRLDKFFYVFAFLFMTLSMVSCSENEDVVEEFPNWQQTNAKYFEDLYYQAVEKQTNGDTSWKVFRNWSFPDGNELTRVNPDDNIVVEVLKEGTGSGCPIYTDYVRCHYKGRLLPSTTYADGYVFDQSYYGDFNEATAIPAEFAVSGVVDGFSTALQKMHIGDSWRVYIPYALGYGDDASKSSIPAYSTLVFDITLVEYYHSDTVVPGIK